MRNILTTAAVASALIGVLPAQAAVLKFQTTSTIGIFQNGGPDPTVNDTSASFGFNIAFTTPDDLHLTDGFFRDANLNALGGGENNTGFFDPDANYASGQVYLTNPDGAFLELDFDPATISLPIVSGSYSFGGGVGDTASGTFVGLVSSVPLPASAPLFGAALVGVGGIGYRLKRRRQSRDA